MREIAARFHGSVKSNTRYKILLDAFNALSRTETLMETSSSDDPTASSCLTRLIDQVRVNSGTIILLRRSLSR